MPRLLLHVVHALSTRSDRRMGRPRKGRAPSWIACRRLTLQPSGKTIWVRVGVPRRADPDWECEFQVSRRGSSRRVVMRGVDALQALIEVVRGIGLAVSAEGTTEWLGGNGPGTPRYIPESLGQDFTDRIGVMIEDEIERLISSKRRIRGPP